MLSLCRSAREWKESLFETVPSVTFMYTFTNLLHSGTRSCHKNSEVLREHLQCRALFTSFLYDRVYELVLRNQRNSSALLNMLGYAVSTLPPWILSKPFLRTIKYLRRFQTIISIYFLILKRTWLPHLDHESSSDMIIIMDLQIFVDAVALLVEFCAMTEDYYLTEAA